jgi:virulence factor Mce-like protein
MNRTRPTAIAASPVLIGAVTVLVALVGLVISYNANQGLPFVPTYEIDAEVPDAAELVVGNEVRVGGTRVGVVTSVDAAASAGPDAEKAVLALKLDKDLEPLPRDTTLEIRQRSNLGLKYVQLTPGRSRTGIPADGTLALAQAAPVTDLEDVLNVFDTRTRQGIRESVTALGDGLAGRGPDLNTALGSFPELFGRLAPVAANLRDPRTELERALARIQSATAAVAPVSEALAGLFAAGATTFGALDSEHGAVEATLAEAPPTEAVGTRVLREVRPVLFDTAALTRELRPGVARLPRAGNRLAAALAAGAPVLKRTPELARRLDGTLAEVHRIARDPTSGGSLRRLTDIVASTRSFLGFANPFQTKCNYLGLWTRNVPGFIKQGDDLGGWFRAGVVVSPTQTFLTPRQAADLHVSPYPDEGQNGECETGNEGFVPGRQVGAVPGAQPGFTEGTSPPRGTPDPPPAPVR